MFMLNPYVATAPGEAIPTSGLIAHLDAGNSASYPGSGQVWANLVASPADGVAQSAYDFVRGSTSSAESVDGAFTGTAGGMTSGEYWAFDGDDYMTLSGGNTAFVNSLHKSGTALTAVFWIQLGSVSGLQPLMSSNGAGASSNPGISFFISNGNLDFQVTNGVADALRVSKTTGLTAGTWNMVAVMFAESASGYFWANGAVVDTSWSASYSSPTTSNAAHTLLLGKFPESTSLASGSRLAKALIYETGMTPDQLAPIWETTRGRFGI